MTVSYDRIILTNEADEKITPYNLVESKTIKADIPVYNESGTARVFAAVVLYDREGKMINVVAENKNVSEGFSTIVLTLNLDKAPQIGDDLKVYVWGNDYIDIFSSAKGVQTVFVKGTSDNGIADIDFSEYMNEGEDDSSDAINTYVNSTDSNILCSDMSIVSAQGFLNEELLESEINGARSALRNMFPEQKVLGYVLPFNACDANVIAKTKEEHYAIRGGGSSSNSIDPTEDELFAVKSYDCNGEVAVDTMNRWVDSAIADGKWIVEMWHGIEGDHIYNPPSKEHVKAHLDHIKSKEESLWVATYTEAIQYIRERQTSRLILLEENDSEIRFILSDTVDDALFDYPLTVRVNVPYSWSCADVSQNGVSEVCTITKDGSDAYLLVEVVTNEKVVTVAKK